MRNRLALLAVISAALSTPAARAADLVVPDQFSTIQAAIDAAVDGDSVLVKPGTYTEALTIGYKTISLASTGGAEVTVLDGAGSFRPLTIYGPNYRPTISGFTIQNGTSWGGGGVYVGSQADPSFHDMVIRNNSAYYGGGMYIGYGACWVQIVDSVIVDNTAVYEGGGTYGNVSCTWFLRSRLARNVAGFRGGGVASMGFCTGAIAEATVIEGNEAGEDGGGMFAGGSSSCGAGVRGRNAVIARNVAKRGGGVGAGSYGGAELIGATVTQNVGGGLNSEGALWNLVTNSILWDNGVAPVFVPGSRVSGVDMEGGVQTGFNGDGTNISADPLFVDPAAGDYRLSAGSPCIDAGVAPDGWQAADITGAPRPDGLGFDMGAYEYRYQDLTAAVVVGPEAINRCVTSGYVTVYVTLPAGWDPALVLAPSVFLNGALAAERGGVENGVFVAKFPREGVVEVLADQPDGTVPLTVTGVLPGYARFSAQSSIRVRTTVCR